MTFSPSIFVRKTIHTHTHLKWCIKKEQTNKKSQPKKTVHEIVNFCSPKVANPKKKSRNTTKCHNNFTILLFLVMVAIGLIFYYFILTYNELTP